MASCPAHPLGDGEVGLMMRDYVLRLFSPSAKKAGRDAYGVAVVYADSEQGAISELHRVHPEWTVENIT